jgi:hypothetical protein
MKQEGIKMQMSELKEIILIGKMPRHFLTSNTVTERAMKSHKEITVNQKVRRPHGKDNFAICGYRRLTVVDLLNISSISKSTCN